MKVENASKARVLEKKGAWRAGTVSKTDEFRIKNENFVSKREIV